MRKSNKSGFTLIELLVVIAMIGLLSGILMGTFGAVRNNAKKSKTLSIVKQMQIAWTQYLTEYHVFPAGISSMDSNALKILCGHTNTVNTLKIPFLDFSDAATDSDYVDGWGNVYKVELAMTGNEVDVNGETIKSTVAVWSLGPDGAEYTKDDIVSWEK